MVISESPVRAIVKPFSPGVCERAVTVSATQTTASAAANFLEVKGHPGAEGSRWKNVGDAAETRLGYGGHRGDGTRVGDVQHVEAEVQRLPADRDFLADAHIELRLVRLRLGAVGLEATRHSGELPERRAARIGGAEH